MTQQNERKEPPKDRPRGRPKKSKSPRVPWRAVDHLLVFGELVTNNKTKANEVNYPSYREIGKRYGVSTALIGRYARDHQCLKRREEARKHEQAAYQKKFAEIRAESCALSDAEAIAVIDSYIIGFRDALEEGRVRADSASDFNTMVRLKEFLSGRADTRQEVQTSITLEQLQERHAVLRSRLDGLEPALTGEIVDDEPEELPQPAPRYLPSVTASTPASVGADSGPERECNSSGSRAPGPGDIAESALQADTDTAGRDAFRVIETRIGRGWMDGGDDSEDSQSP